MTRHGRGGLYIPQPTGAGIVRLRLVELPPRPTPAQLVARVADQLKRLDAQLARLEQRYPTPPRVKR